MGNDDEKELAAQMRRAAANPESGSFGTLLTSGASTIERLEQERDALREALRKPHTIAARMRQIVQEVWDKRPGYTDRQAWSDLHGQAMQLLEWDVSTTALNQTRTDASEGSGE